jgi:hypothetical protein
MVSRVRFASFLWTAVDGATQQVHGASKTRVNAPMVWCAADPRPFQTLALGTVPDQRRTAP